MLVKVEGNVISEHLVDDPDELAGAMPESIVMGSAFRHLLVVLSLKSLIVLYNIMRFVDERKA